MYPLPNNNFNGIALALMKDAVRVDSIRPDAPRPEGKNLFYPLQIDDVPLEMSTIYLRRQRLTDSRILDVEFHDAFFGDASFNTLEIKLKPSETNPVGFETEEQCWTRIKELARHGGFYSWLSHIGREPLLEMFRQYEGPDKWVHYSPQERKKAAVDGNKKESVHLTMPPSEVDEVTSRYQRLASEVLAVLEGKSDTITVS